MDISPAAEDATHELEFVVRDSDRFFVDLAGREGCRVALEHLIRRSDERLLEFFTVGGTSAKQVLTFAAETPNVVEARAVSEGGDSGLFEFVISEASVATTLADVGAVARTVVADDGRGRVIANVPPHIDVRTVVETFREEHADADLIAQRKTDHYVPVQSTQDAQVALGDRLTDKQLEVLWTAYRDGYFDWPRNARPRNVQQRSASLSPRSASTPVWHRRRFSRRSSTNAPIPHPGAESAFDDSSDWAARRSIGGRYGVMMARPSISLCSRRSATVLISSRSYRLVRNSTSPRSTSATSSCSSAYWPTSVPS